MEGGIVMNLRWRKCIVVSLLTSFMLYPILLFTGPVQASSAADEFDLLRERWHVYLTGDGNRYVGPGNCSENQPNRNQREQALVSDEHKRRTNLSVERSGELECLQHDFIQLCKAEGNGTGLFHNGVFPQRMSSWLQTS